MGLLLHLIIVLIHLLLTGIDILGFFILLRLILLIWSKPWAWLIAFNTAGEPVIEWYLNHFQNIPYIRQQNLSFDKLLVVSLLVLLVVRYIVISMLQGL